MSYTNKVPNDIESPTAYDIHIEYCLGKGYNPVHYVQCIERYCSECSKDNLYRVCPGCGTTLEDCAGMRECTCGTIMYVCLNNSGPLVTRYATPNKIFRIEEDTI